MISHELKNVSERMAAVKYSVVIRVSNERLQCDPFTAFNPVMAHKLVHSRAVSRKICSLQDSVVATVAYAGKTKFRSESRFLVLATR
jgi:hypothetical protein